MDFTIPTKIGYIVLSAAPRCLLNQSTIDQIEFCQSIVASNKRCKICFNKQALDNYINSLGINSNALIVVCEVRLKYKYGTTETDVNNEDIEAFVAITKIYDWQALITAFKTQLQQQEEKREPIPQALIIAKEPKHEVRSSSRQETLLPTIPEKGPAILPQEVAMPKFGTAAEARQKARRAVAPATNAHALYRQSIPKPPEAASQLHK